MVLQFLIPNTINMIHLPNTKPKFYHKLHQINNKNPHMGAFIDYFLVDFLTGFFTVFLVSPTDVLDAYFCLLAS